MRILLYGMQSSGASAIALLLAQNGQSAAFVDIWNMFAAPELETDLDVVAKVVATTAYPIAIHRKRFKPDLTVLVLRHPVDNYISLASKSYAHESGLLNEKFRVMEAVVSERAEFDHLIFYEDFAFCPGDLISYFSKWGWAIDYSAILLKRSEQAIRSFNNQAIPRIVGRLNYGVGSFQSGGIRRDRVRFAAAAAATGHLPRMCPAMFGQYEAVWRDRQSKWHVCEPALLSCDLGPLLRAGDGKDDPRARPCPAVVVEGADRCIIHDGMIEIRSGAGGIGPRIEIRNLPGSPFNRLSGVLAASHDWTGETSADLLVVSAQGTRLAEAKLTVRHGGVALFELSYAAPEVPVTFVVSASGAGEEASAARWGSMWINNIRIEHMER